MHAEYPFNLTSRRMSVSDIMTSKPVTTTQNNTLYEALDLMESVPCHHLPVIGHEGHLIGVISARDCTRALECWQHQHLNDTHINGLKVKNIMSPAPIVIEPSSSVVEAARLMLNNDIRCLPVMRGETLVGIITTSDLLIAFMQLFRD